MEVSRRRSLQKHLEPARPLRRFNNVDQEPFRNMDTFAYPQVEDKSINNIGVEQFYKILQLHTQNEEKSHKVRICYSREFLIELASSPVAKRKPDFLPEHPVVLEKARDPSLPRLVEKCDKRWNEGNVMLPCMDEF
ncbi:uncharacterized protein C8orf88 homolog [Hypomesus transpacificus]|uniref:uncharacterized protein C8orf88 homolog n=1 Tax=Hypomesus transpacificus TaxID=137520 RepID=UPI001F07B8B9|nr:uncharacterized protein C8orf88 homolog [Hypomesus transpacificus]